MVVVNTDQEWFDGLTIKEQSKLARKIIQQRFVGKVIGTANRAYVNGDTAREYAFPVKKQAGEIREAKYRAAPELDKLLDCGFNFRTAPDGRDGHIHSEAVDDFRYFDVIFRVGTEYYQGTLNIIPIKRGLRLKDLTKIKNITEDIFDSYGQNPQVKFLNDVSEDTVPQTESESQDNYSVDDEEYLDAVERGDMERAQEMVDEVARAKMPDTKIVDEDGKPLTVYHGTSESFTVFDMSKGRANMDIQGSFFSPWELDAQGYGENVGAYYLNITNPADESTAYRALNRYKGQNGAGVKAREYLISRGYDGVNNSDEEYIAFYPSQIKSAEPVTYDDDGNVIPLEMHSDEKPKGKNTRVDGVATFGSLLRTKTGDIPIKLTVKLYDANTPKLHVIINNRNRNTFVKEARFQFPESEATENVPDVVTVADFLRFVKDDAEFTKRIPMDAILRGDSYYADEEDAGESGAADTILKEINVVSTSTNSVHPENRSSTRGHMLTTTVRVSDLFALVKANDSSFKPTK